MLTLNDITYRLGERLLLDKASAFLPTGSRVGLVGRNGTGKTTLFRIITGDLSPEGGNVALPRGMRIGGVAQEAPGGPETLIEVVLAADTERATLMKEAMFHGVRCGVIHPGFTDTPMVRALGEDYIKEHILPQTQLRRLIRPEEIADAICFMIGNSAVSGQLWADAGWHPIA